MDCNSNSALVKDLKVLNDLVLDFAPHSIDPVAPRICKHCAREAMSRALVSTVCFLCKDRVFEHCVVCSEGVFDQCETCGVCFGKIAHRVCVKRIRGKEIEDKWKCNQCLIAAA